MVIFMSGVNVPEVPNLFMLFNDAYDGSTWSSLLQSWDSIIFSLISALTIFFLLYFGAKKGALIPSGLQNFVEWLVELIRNAVLEILGPQGEKYVPFLGTLFLYILLMNWLVLIPFFKAPSSSYNITLALAVCVFCYVQYLNIKNYGIKGFIYHMAGEPKNAVQWLLSPMMFCIEILTQLTRPLTLSLRLFGNIYGEDILIGTFSLFGVAILSGFNAPIGLPLQVPFLFLALFTGLLQALVFTYLSTIYILLSIPKKDH